MKRSKLLIGNWKMNGSLAMATDLVQGILKALPTIPADVEVVVCPPAVYLPALHAQIGALQLGAQTLSEFESGAYTGEISGSMLKELGCHYVIVGHSERRQYFHETSQQVALKAQRAIHSGLKPIVCVGETATERSEGLTEKVIQSQLQPIFESLSVAELEHCVLAYEPVWAIGTGLTATPEQIQSVHAFIRNLCRNCSPNLANTVRIVYGGSVKPEGAQTLFALSEVDGALVGGASLKVEQFTAIYRALESECKV